MKLKVVTKKKSDYVRFEPTFVFTTPWSIETTCYWRYWFIKFCYQRIRPIQKMATKMFYRAGMQIVHDSPMENFLVGRGLPVRIDY